MLSSPGMQVRGGRGAGANVRCGCGGIALRLAPNEAIYASKNVPPGYTQQIRESKCNECGTQRQVTVSVAAE